MSGFRRAFVYGERVSTLPPVVHFTIFVLLARPSEVPLFGLLTVRLLVTR